jgi:pimeloyl-ACP methyl ester carboxylesterase
MTEAPAESFLELPAGRFRALTWDSGDETVLFLHGLTGVSEVWQPTIEALRPGHRCVALDLRGHGHSPQTPGHYSAGDMARDVRDAITKLGVSVHLVGHSMGARVAIVVAARYPELLHSAAIVDIGPEASTANIADTVRGISRRPERFADEAEALAFAFRTRIPTESDKRILLARLCRESDGTLTWRSSREALIECVTAQRSRNYWAEWRGISAPTVFIHGGASNEVSTAIADRMVAENPRVRFDRFEGVGHNIPLLAPEQLAAVLYAHWTSTSASAT